MVKYTSYLWEVAITHMKQLHGAVADLYLYLFNAALMNPTGTAHGHEGFYFAENGEHTLYQVGKAICEAMITVGECSEPEPSTFTDEEIQQYFHVSSRSPQDKSGLIICGFLGIKFMGMPLSLSS
jgi:hypothetical protein